jgi:hypothetical protein
VRSNVNGIRRKASALALGLLFALPTVGFAQDGCWRNQDGREERRKHRQERREERRGRGQERRAAHSGYAWGNYNNWGDSFQLRQMALNACYNEGIKEGRRDRQRGENFNFTSESDYPSATKDYSSRLGDRALYRRYFQQGFENGYSDGWNGY